MKKIILLASIILLFISVNLGEAKASLMTDPDGFSVELTIEGSSDNFFGPDTFTENYDPFGGFGNILPAPFVDGTEIEVSFFSRYIEIKQFVRSTFDPVAVPWFMLFSNIETSNPIASVSIDSLSSTFTDELIATSTGSSIAINFAGGSTDSLQIGGDEWFARIDIEFESVSVSSPSIFVLIVFSAIFAVRRAKGWYQ